MSLTETSLPEKIKSIESEFSSIQKTLTTTTPPAVYREQHDELADLAKYGRDFVRQVKLSTRRGANRDIEGERIILRRAEIIRSKLMQNVVDIDKGHL